MNDLSTMQINVRLVDRSREKKRKKRERDEEEEKK